MNTSAPPSNRAAQYAVLDLGSNSFSLVFASVEENRVRKTGKIKDVIRLSAGLDRQNRISDKYLEKAWTSLKMMRPHLKDFSEDHVRVVATSALRNARNSDVFVEKGEKILGRRIEIISGQEEARLIYKGVQNEFRSTIKRKLVLDIGGGSTEIIYGHGSQAKVLESIKIGNLSLQRRTRQFKKFSPHVFDLCVQDVTLFLKEIRTHHFRNDWDIAIGSSGTMRSIENVIKAQKLEKSGITRTALNRLIECVYAGCNKTEPGILGLSEDRQASFPYALAILYALFLEFNINELRVSRYGLREGLFYELAHVEDRYVLISAAIENMVQGYGVSLDKARDIQRTALHLYSEISSTPDREKEVLLLWSTLLHESGKHIAWQSYQKHSAYIVKHSYIEGLAVEEKEKVTALIRNHRKKIRKQNPFPDDEPLLHALVAFRLACIFYYHRLAEDSWRISLKDTTLQLCYRNGQREEDEAIVRDFEKEKTWLADLGLNLEIELRVT